MTTSLEKEAAGDAEAILAKYILQTKNELENIIRQDNYSQIAAICRYIIQAGGKRLRPLLTLLACEAVGGDFRKAVPASVATELAHTLSIIQDDVFDQATFRRGVKPVHVAWGTPTAILASDYLFLKMVGQILKTADLHANSNELTLKVLKVVVEAGLEAVEGEYLDLQLAENEKATVEDWTLVAKKKTGSLIEAALETGALIGGGTQEEITALRNYGGNLGIAYQAIDDTLGLTASPELMGKDIGSDITNKRMTIVTAHALQNSSAQRERILSALKKHEERHTSFADCLSIFEKTGSIGFAQKLAWEYAEKAVNSLGPLRSTEAKTFLESVPMIMVNRKW